MSYDNFAETFSKSREHHPWPELDAIIESIKKGGFSNILDIGCGNGRFLEEARKADLRIEQYLGIDSSAGMIEQARKIHPEDAFAVCPMESLSHSETLRPSHWEAIVFLASFHHLETHGDRLKVLQDIKLFLKPHGRVYMTNWNLRGQSRYEKNHRENGDYDIKIGEYLRYYHGFTVEELQGLFQESGWKIIKNEVFAGGRNIVSILQNEAHDSHVSR